MATELGNLAELMAEIAVNPMVEISKLVPMRDAFSFTQIYLTEFITFWLAALNLKLLECTKVNSTSCTVNLNNYTAQT